MTFDYGELSRRVALWLADGGDPVEIVREFHTFGTWPWRLVNRTARPHPLLCEKLIRWLDENPARGD